MKVGTGMKGVSRKTILPNEPTGRRVASVSPGNRKTLPGLHLRDPVPPSQVAGMQVYVTERTQKPPGLRGVRAAAQGWHRQTCLSVDCARRESTHKQACMCHPGEQPSRGRPGYRGSRRFVHREETPSFSPLRGGKWLGWRQQS